MDDVNDKTINAPSLSKLPAKAATPLPNPMSTAEAPSTHTYLSLIKDVRQGRARAITGFDQGGSHVGFARWKGDMWLEPLDGRALRLERPNYDFDHLSDRQHPSWLGGDAYDYLLDQGLKHFSQHGTILPHPKCAYLFRCVEDEFDYARTYCVVMEETALGIDGLVFIRQDVPIGHAFSRWVLDGASFQVSPNGACLVFLDLVEHQAPKSARDMLVLKTEQVIADVLVSSMLLRLPPDVMSREQQKESFVLRQYNGKRRRGESRLGAPILIGLNRTLLAETIPPTKRGSTGTPRSAHERRAHTRVIYRGTERERPVEVKAASIHGGKSMQSYKVVV